MTDTGRGPRTEDFIVVNGGEPTLHPGVMSIFSLLGSTGAYVTLFTNGRTLADPGTAEKVIGTGVSRLTVPIYGHDSQVHDACTQSAGSWTQTIQGLNNVFSLRISLGRRVHVELKTLVCSRTLNSLAATVQFIRTTFSQCDRYVLSGLIQSETARGGGAVVDLSDPRVVSAVEGGVSEALKMSTFVSLDSIPLCLLTPPVRSQWLLKRARQELASPLGGGQFVYFDCEWPEGRVMGDSWQTCHCPHQGCRFHPTCRMNDQYFDEELTKAVKPSYPKPA